MKRNEPRARLHQTAIIPLYEQVYNDVDRRLWSGEWAAGDQLPTEAEFMEYYDCSSITIRRALTDLSREGRIERRRGKGTFAMPPRIERDLASFTSFSEEMYHRGLAPQTRLIGATTAQAGREIAEALQMGIGEEAYLIERLRMANGSPILFEQVYLSAQRFPNLLAEDLAAQSLYSVLTSTYAVSFGSATEEVDAVLLTGLEAQLLEQPQSRPALEIHLTSFDSAGVPVEFCRSLVRGGSTRYRIELGSLATFERATRIPLLA